MIHRIPPGSSSRPGPARVLALVVAILLSPMWARAGEPPEELRLGYFANVTHAQAVLGVHSGDFAKALAPSRLTTRVFNAGPSLIESLFAGEIDVGYVGPSPAINAHLQSRGRGVRVVAGAAANGVVIVVAPGSGIERLEDLKGRRVATPQMGNTQDMSARHYLTKVLGQPNADNVLPIPNSEHAAMMTRGEIDASWSVEPWGARLVAEAGGRIIAEEKDLWPGGEFVLTLVVTSPEFLRDHPETIERLLRAHSVWTARLSADSAGCTQELSDALTDLTGKRLGAEIIGAAISRVKFTDVPNLESLETFARWSYDLGLARSVPSIPAMLDTGILDRVRAAQDPDGPAPPDSSPAPPARAPGHP